MPTLEWIGKSKVVNHHQEVPFRVLERQYEVREDLREKILWSYETLNIKFSAYSFQETFLLFQNMVKLI